MSFYQRGGKNAAQKIGMLLFHDVLQFGGDGATDMASVVYLPCGGYFSDGSDRIIVEEEDIHELYEIFLSDRFFNDRLHYVPWMAQRLLQRPKDEVIVQLEHKKLWTNELEMLPPTKNPLP